MNRDDVNWRGYWPACPTPFTADGSYDAESHRALLEWYIGEGMHGVFINGTTGEWFSQTPDERRLVAETAIDQVAGRVPVVIGCTAYTAREAARARPSRDRGGADGHRLDTAALLEDVPRRDGRVLPGHLATASTRR